MTNDEVNVLELSLGKKEIGELISELKVLKKTGKSIHLDVDNENQLIIHREGEENEI